MNKLLLQTATLIAVAGGTAWAFSASHTPHTTTSTSATSGRSSAATSQHTTQTTPSSSTTPSHAHTQTNRYSNPSSGSKVANTDSQSHQTNTASSATHPTSNGIWNVDLVGLPGNQGTDYTLSFGTGGSGSRGGMILQQGIDTQHQAMVDMWSWHYRTGLPIAGTGISGNQAAADLAKVGVTFHPTS